jgi:hypothetical protein
MMGGEDLKASKPWRVQCLFSSSPSGRITSSRMLREKKMRKRSHVHIPRDVLKRTDLDIHLNFLYLVAVQSYASKPLLPEPDILAPYHLAAL